MLDYEFLRFLRPKLCLPIASIGAAAYVLFNPLGWGLVLVITACIFLTFGGYSLNVITDREEDLLNTGEQNSFAGRRGIFCVVLFYMAGAAVAALFSPSLLMFYLIIAGLSIIYSIYRLKGVFPFKNIYTGAMAGAFFVFGSTLISGEILLYAFAVTLFFFVVSLLGDLRDCRGDRLAGIRTVPVKLGYATGRGISSAFLLAAVVFTLLFNLSFFYVLLPFAVGSMAAISVDKAKTAQHYLLTGFLSLFFIYSIL